MTAAHAAGSGEYNAVRLIWRDVTGRPDAGGRHHADTQYSLAQSQCAHSELSKALNMLLVA